jgi:hypothetical protein
MSATIRISREDKARLEKLARRMNAKTLTQALRMALQRAEEADERFSGNLGALSKTLKSARGVGGCVSGRVDEELAKAIKDR